MARTAEEMTETFEKDDAATKKAGDNTSSDGGSTHSAEALLVKVENKRLQNMLEAYTTFLMLQEMYIRSKEMFNTTFPAGTSTVKSPEKEQGAEKIKADLANLPVTIEIKSRFDKAGVDLKSGVTDGLTLANIQKYLNSLDLGDIKLKEKYFLSKQSEHYIKGAEISGNLVKLMHDEVHHYPWLKKEVAALVVAGLLVAAILAWGLANIDAFSSNGNTIPALTHNFFSGIMNTTPAPLTVGLLIVISLLITGVIAGLVIHNHNVKMRLQNEPSDALIASKMAPFKPAVDPDLAPPPANNAEKPGFKTRAMNLLPSWGSSSAVTPITSVVDGASSATAASTSTATTTAPTGEKKSKVTFSLPSLFSKQSTEVPLNNIITDTGAGATLPESEAGSSSSAATSMVPPVQQHPQASSVPVSDQPQSQSEPQPTAAASTSTTTTTAPTVENKPTVAANATTVPASSGWSWRNPLKRNQKPVEIKPAQVPQQAVAPITTSTAPTATLQVVASPQPQHVVSEDSTVAITRSNTPPSTGAEGAMNSDNNGTSAVVSNMRRNSVGNNASSSNAVTTPVPQVDQATVPGAAATTATTTKQPAVSEKKKRWGFF